MGFCAFEVDRLYQDPEFYKHTELAIASWLSHRFRQTSSAMLKKWELSEICRYAFVKATCRFEKPPRPGSPEFVAYASSVVQSKIRGLRKKKKIPGLSLSADNQVLESLQSVDDSLWPSSSNDLNDFITAFRKGLNERENRVFTWMIEERHGLEEMAKELGISRRTLERIREHLRERFKASFEKNWNP